MAANLIQRTFVKTPTTDVALTLANSEYMRKTGLSTWTQLRIGVLCALTPNGTSNITNASLFVGLVSSNATFANTIGYGAGTGGHVYGVDLAANISALGTLTYSGTTDPYYVASTVNQVKRRVGSTTTNNSVGVATPGLVTNTGATQRRSPILVDIIKGANWAVNVRGVNSSTNAAFDYSTDSFFDFMEHLSPSTGQTLGQGQAAGLAIDEATNGTLDTVCVFWNNATLPLEIYAIAVQRLA